MKDSKQVINSAAQEISRSQNSSPTAAGPTDAGSNQTRAVTPTPELVDTINQVFGLFRLNFGNLYYASFKSQELEVQAKRLWLETLGHMAPEAILRGAKSVISQCEYLPTLKVMLDHCQAAAGEQLPGVHEAYVEACNAASPKAAAQWSHPAVYHAGKASDWYFLASSNETVALPVFRQHYLKLCEQVRQGISLAQPTHEALPEPNAEPLSAEENKARLKALRDTLDI